MLDHAEINLSTLLIWIGAAVGVAMVVMGDLEFGELVSHLGLIVIVVTCALGVRRAVVARDESLRCAFDAGREHERSQGVRSLV